MTRRVLLVGLGYTGPEIPGVIVETRGLCRRQSFQLQSAARLSEYEVVVIWPQSYSHILFGEPTEFTGSPTELADLKRAEIADFGNAFWWHERAAEMREALRMGTRVIWLAVPDRPARFFGSRSLYDGYALPAAEQVLHDSTLAERSPSDLVIKPAGAALAPYFEAVRGAGSSLCWIPGSAAQVSQIPLAVTREGYSLGAQLLTEGTVTWLLTPPPTAAATATLLRCALGLRPAQVRSTHYHGIFLSHNSEDKPFVRRLRAALVARGAEDVWVDEAELLVGDSLLQKIGEGIDRTEYFGIVLSPRSVRSPWVQLELEQAMTEQIRTRAVKVLPLLYEPCELPAFLRGKIYLNFSDEATFEDALGQLLRRLEKDGNDRR